MNKYVMATVRPTIDVLPNTSFNAGDLLFDWFRFEIPNGGVNLKTIFGICPGTNAVAGNTLDMNLVFATSLKGSAPPSLGSPDDAPTVIKGAAVRNHLIGHVHLDLSKLTNADTEFVGYNVLTQSGQTGNDLNEVKNIMQGDPNYAGTTQGYQSIWVAGFSVGALDFGTNVLLDGAVSSAGAQTLDVSEDGDADDVFCIGDELLAAASDGSSVQKIGTITALTADTITVDAKDINGTTVWASGALADDDEICFRRPLTFNFGFEY
tara:strand:- start:55 stop:849 length:795 start_codon:yes stop_codon:yes gene_type:complete